MSEKEKSFSTRRFVSVMTLCMFLVTSISGIVLLLSHGRHTPEAFAVMFKWRGMHEIGCVFFFIFGVWHFVLNFKVMIRYFMGKNNRKIVFRMDWGIPVIIAIFFFMMIYLLPTEKHDFQDFSSMGYSREFNAH